jgi:hypothetical protein
MQAFSDVQRVTGIDVDDASNDDAGNDDGSDFAPEVHFFKKIPCIPYSLHWIHLLGDPTEEQDTSEGRGPQTDTSGYL